MPGPVLDQLVPAGRTTALPPAPDEPDLVALLRRPRARLVRANMVASVDGAAHGPDDRSGSLGSPADARVFAVLRALADVVLVGAGTVRAEGYRELPVPAGLRDVRRALGLAPGIVLAVVTRSGRVPEEVLDGPGDVLVVTGDGGAGQAVRAAGSDRVLHVPSTDHDGPDLARAVDALVARGLPHVLAEGGPRLLADLLGAGLVDELCLTTSPVVVGGTAPRVVADGPWLEPGSPARLAHLLHAPDGTLLACWALRGHAPVDDAAV
ncbi:dihydrofolate reductase family protein [Cellulomonas oligotrophica]|uniref:Riboflavin biosynthesis pyrimidine reductase n=1 Tax=Cellulomonas oligotrophica TaxID=931536 RepID=A0A7Y9FEK1_9CELL|nr:dihydrofolate reductase family protein [Cellulomonas oligotrophica]NYD84586.1 riboflavin biosynthesis pyrimidine reductase [Cellulomonas oligotrophica]GIG31652.1 hypothetical protein Col01nite_08110 [Cellulomonas oligotrophica]